MRVIQRQVLWNWNLPFDPTDRTASKELAVGLNLPLDYSHQYPLKAFLGKFLDAVRSVGFPKSRWTRLLITCFQEERTRARYREQVLESNTV